ncbi:MAG: hypothetical protein GY943_21450 [Chloroflexi bacterium]|nr:hypothetical protein [Chloroflexota bacterium]
MNDQKFQPIQTRLGTIYGRDAIFLDELDVEIRSGFIKLSGSLNGKLCSKASAHWYNYELVFSNILAFKVIELDSWNFSYSVSSFDEIINSMWIQELGGKVKPSHKHYLVQTYDDVIEVVCKSVKIQISIQDSIE